VEAEIVRQRRLAEPARAPERDGRRDSIALVVEQLRLERGELIGALDEALRRVGRHERHPILTAGPGERLYEPLPLLRVFDVVDVHPLEPARNASHLELLPSPYRAHLPPFLARQPQLLLDDRSLERT